MPRLGEIPRKLPLLLRNTAGERRPLLRAVVGELSPACAGELGNPLAPGELGSLFAGEEAGVEVERGAALMGEAAGRRG